MRGAEPGDRYRRRPDLREMDAADTGARHRPDRPQQDHHDTRPRG